jgi:hypothetical protein
VQPGNESRRWESPARRRADLRRFPTSRGESIWVVNERGTRAV